MVVIRRGVIYVSTVFRQDVFSPNHLTLMTFETRKNDEVRICVHTYTYIYVPTWDVIYTTVYEMFSSTLSTNGERKKQNDVPLVLL